MSDASTDTAVPMVVVFPRGQLSAKDRERLTEHGILAVEADDPKAVVTLLPSAPFVSPDDLLMAALKGVTSGEWNARGATFAAELHRRLLARETNSPPLA